MKRSTREVVTYVFTRDEVIDMLTTKTGALGDPAVSGIGDPVELTFEQTSLKTDAKTDAGRPSSTAEMVGDSRKPGTKPLS